nr:MAG TPA: hypothetical protein [Caudoviricetes sp.]
MRVALASLINLSKCCEIILIKFNRHSPTSFRDFRLIVRDLQYVVHVLDCIFNGSLYCICRELQIMFLCDCGELLNYPLLLILAKICSIEEHFRSLYKHDCILVKSIPLLIVQLSLDPRYYNNGNNCAEQGNNQLNDSCNVDCHNKTSFLLFTLFFLHRTNQC